ncbi:MAG: hypothetical protein ACXV3C_00290 [Actinomycetes bacterium]
MLPETGYHQVDVAAACRVLAPHRWRTLTSETVARLVLGALDGQRVDELVACLGTPSVADRREVRPAERGDERVDVLVDVLASHRWRSSTVHALCARLVGSLNSWRVDRACLELELHWLMPDET